MKSTAWPASLAGPALIAVAQPLDAWAPASSLTVWLAPLVKLGTSLTGLTVIVIDAVSLLRLPSLARYVKLSEPLKFAVGVYVTVALSELGEPASTRRRCVIAPRLPFAGVATIENVSSHWLGSVAVRATATGASSLVVADAGEAAGAVFVTSAKVAISVWSAPPVSPMKNVQGVVVPVHVVTRP